MKVDNVRECPFCGSDDIDFVHNSNEAYGKCNNCNSFSSGTINFADAVVNWNKRVSDSELEKTIRKLTVELKSVKDGVAQIMENVDEDGWAYEWCSKILS
jgi:hypothetical protein